MTSPSIAYLIIEPDGETRTVHGTLDVKDAQQLLDDDFEILQPTNPPPFIMLVATNGKEKGLNANWGATRVMSSVLKPDDFIVGRAIVAGPPDGIGEPTSVDVPIEEAIRRRVEQ